MTDTKISELPPANTIFGDERLPVGTANQFATIGQVQLGNGQTSYASRIARFGSGADGDVTLNSGITLTRDMYYNNLTMIAGGYIATMGYRIYVKESLNLTSCSTGAIRFSSAPNGGDAAGATGGAAGGATDDASVGGSGGAGTAGANGGTGNGPSSAAGANINGNGGRGGASSNNLGGKGGDGSGTTGGLGRSGPTVSNRLSVDRIFVDFLRGGTLIRGGSSAVGGAAGGGDGADSGGGGGGGGTGGGVVVVFARNIIRGTFTPQRSITAGGGNGGAGGTPAGGNCGGGGGGNGGGGGWLYVVYESLAGTPRIGLLSASGGNGGTGGNGTGTGIGGQGGQGGGGGQINAICSVDGLSISYNRSTAVSTTVSIPSTSTGSVGTSGVTALLTL